MGLIRTIGHSTLSLTEFTSHLERWGIGCLADVRRHPGSRRLPHFGQDRLSDSLHQSGILYDWIPELGGRRRPAMESVGTGWRNESFQGYADHTETEEFALGLSRLENDAHAMSTAVMCAEALWWRCHRSIIADVMKWTGWEVWHIMPDGSPAPHPWTGAAGLCEGQLCWAEGVELLRKG